MNGMLLLNKHLKFRVLKSTLKIPLHKRAPGYYTNNPFIHWKYGPTINLFSTAS